MSWLRTLAKVVRAAWDNRASVQPEGWVCGACSPLTHGMEPYRCTRPWGHRGFHGATVDGVLVAGWPPVSEREHR